MVATFIEGSRCERCNREAPDMLPSGALAKCIAIGKHLYCVNDGFHILRGMYPELSDAEIEARHLKKIETGGRYAYLHYS